MTIYALIPDGNAYQYLLGDSKEDRTRLTFTGERQGEDWRPPAVYIHEPKLKRGNFLGVNMLGGALACDAYTRDRDGMAELLEMSAELHPFSVDCESYYFINVTHCVNVLDRDRSEWHPSMMKVGKVGGPAKYVFHPRRIPETPLFKIPETSSTQILCAEGVHDPAYEFKQAYDCLGLTGLKFNKLWSDEA